MVTEVRNIFCVSQTKSQMGLDNISNNDNVNLNIIPGNKKYYHRYTVHFCHI